jgi:hypothetical protein
MWRRYIVANVAILTASICLCSLAGNAAAQTKKIKQQPVQNQAESTSQSGQNVIRIDCPLRKAITKITDPLPGGWWTTPMEWLLVKTVVELNSPEPWLICQYGQNPKQIVGGVASRFPQGVSRCEAITGGFLCYTGSGPAAETPKNQPTKIRPAKSPKGPAPDVEQR